MGKNTADDDDEMYVDLELDDGTVTCSIVTIFSADNKDYIALLPLDENGENHDGEVWLYGHEEDAEGNPSLRNITDEEEYEIACDAFDEYLDGQEFDELIESDGDEEA